MLRAERCALYLVLPLLLLLAAPGWAATIYCQLVASRRFRDVPAGFWAEPGIVADYDDDTYRPTVVVTRDQMAVYVARAFGGAG